MLDQIREMISEKQIEIIRAEYKYAELDGDERQMREVTEPYYDEIAALSEEELRALRSVQSSFRCIDDPYSDIIHQIYESLRTVTTRDIVLYRCHGLDMPNRIIYSTSMKWSVPYEYSGSRYINMNCIYVPKGSVIIPTAAVAAADAKRRHNRIAIDDRICRDAYDADTEREIILDSTYVNKLGPHLWGVIPRMN